ncbi:MAG: hypothetical protein Q9169_004581 [Polycauliona sp. 2 TL-2023]
MAYPPPQGGPPTSYKTNVNRAKTKRWVEAKSYSYDGDDWGEMDEYDEYGGYDEPPPPPRPTGLRQRGQSASRDQPSPSYGHPQQSQHAYGNLGGQPPAQQQYGARSATNPPYQPSQLQRSGSFDQGDERRAFSATAPHQGLPPTSGMYPEASYTQSPGPTPQNYQPGAPSPHPGSHPDMQDRSFQQDRNHPHLANNPPLPHSEQYRRTSMGSRTQSMTSNSSANDLHNRRNFSPSAVPPPLHTRDSPSPQRMSDYQSTSRPPRKSSLSQQNHPEQLHARQGSVPPAEMHQEDRPGALRERAGSDLSKPLPFVRPADIYRRMQEEKERERQSQDSSRPSMEAIMANNQTKIDPGSDSIGVSERRRDIQGEDVLASSMKPVEEHKSEYGMSGFPASETEPREAQRGQRIDVVEPAKRAGPSQAKSNLSPQLPDVTRMSGFGELFASAPQKAEASPAPSAPQPDEATHGLAEQQPDDRSDSPLQHQPSLGFRSVVHQAFDTTTDPIPETPSSSTADSSLDRSGSGGTSAVSPIISRGPSSATTNLNSREPQIPSATPPAMDKRDSEDRPLSSGSLSTPKADARRHSPDSPDQRPARFMPGHRRDISTPSPDNSPARTPALEVNKQLQQPQEAVLAVTTPIETRFPHPYEQPTTTSSGRTSPAKSTGTAEPANPIRPTGEELPQSPAESTRSRVRNLADRFESGRSSPAASERAPSPVKTNFAPNPVTSQPRPLPADRLESFRPKLPGGWESSASIAPLAPPTKSETVGPSVPLEERLQNTTADYSGKSGASSTSTGGQIERQHPEASSPVKTQVSSPISDPYASLAAAGSALAGAFSTAVGSTQDDSDRDHPAEFPVKAAGGLYASAKKEADDRTAPKVVMSADYIPEASKPMMLATPDDGTSSIMPTPLDKLSQPGLSGDSRAADYFATGTDQQQQRAVDSNATQDSAGRKRPVLLPSLSTDNGSQYESDRLRREIIRELSPRLKSEPSTAESNSPMQNDTKNPDRSRQQHESLIIPREYDSYWNGSDSERSSRASSVKGPSQGSREVMPSSNSNQSSASPRFDVEKPPPTPREENSQPYSHMSDLPEKPRPLSHRFSWEAPREHTPPESNVLPNPSQPPPQAISARDDDFADSGPSPLSSREIPSQQDVDKSTLDQASINVGAASIQGDNQHSLYPQDDNNISEAKRSMESAENDRSVVLGNPVHAEQPEAGVVGSESPSTKGEPSQHQGIGPGVELGEDPLKPLSTANDPPLPPMPAGVPPKIQGFREILSLKEARDRIKGFDEAREQVANMNTGLAHWLAISTTELSEHKEILPNGRLAGTPGAKPLSSRTKLGNLLPSGSYANPPSGASDGSYMSGGTTNPTYSPSGGSVKLSSQQMQTRGKDLLHTAGLFGGKANVAAKGFFSKGKSKFRGANADKAPTSSVTNQDRGLPSTENASQTSPVTPQGDAKLEQPQSSKRSGSSRPGSLVVSSQNEAHRNFSAENQDQPQSPSPLASSHNNNGRSTPRSRSISTPTNQDQIAGLDSHRNITSNLLTTERNEVDVMKTQGTQKDLDVMLHHDDQIQSFEGSDPNASNNQTPTQADYADYFQRGSSPSADVPPVTSTGTKQEASNEETQIQQPSLERDDSHALQSRDSTKTPQEGSTVDADPMGSNQNEPSARLGNLQRGSEDSDGTFHTAGSTVGRGFNNTTTGSHQRTQSADQDQSTASSVSRSSSGNSASITPQIAVPAANIRDQPQARPFSFIQFSHNAATKPLDDYSRRRPSVDSLPGRIDPEQDVPPSPISPQYSMVHEPHDLSGKSIPAADGVGFEPSVDGARPRSNIPSRSFSRPFQEPRRETHPAIPREPSPTTGNDLPPQHYPAPIPRQDPVHPRQQTTEYSIEGVGPPPAPQPGPRPTESRSSSKRGSRSSVFFKSFRSPTESTSPPLVGEREEPEDTQRHDDPTIRKTKSKRSSLFRSLTSGTKSSRGEEPQKQQDVVHPTHAGPSDEHPPRPQVPIQATSTQEHRPSDPIIVEKDNANPPAKTPSKYRNRLSRPAAAKGQEQPPPEPGKKKRFSGLGSLFGRSKDNRGSSNVPVDGPQKGPEQVIPEESQQPKERTGRLSSMSKPGRGSAVSSSEKPSSRDVPYHATRDSLTKQGLLPPKPRQSSSRSPEPSAYSQTSSRQGPTYPSRHQSLGQVPPRQEQRPSDWPRQSSSTSSNIQPPYTQAPEQRHRIQSTVTARSQSGHPSGPMQSNQKPRQLSSFTTTTTTTTRGGKTSTSTRQDSLGNNFARSNSPPPPPPPPKDAWRQPNSHQRSMSSTSAVQNAVDIRMQSPNNQQSHVITQLANVSPPPPTQARTYTDQFTPSQSMGAVSPPTPQSHHPRFASTPTHQSLPPLQTNMSHSSSSPAAPRPYNANTNHSSDSDARKLRRSQIESSSGTPRAESATISIGAGMPDPEAVRKYRRSQIESAGGTPKADSAGAPEVATIAATGEKTTTGDSRSRSRGRKSEDEPIVMTATSFPGQEWQPSYAGWDEY